MQKSMTGYGKTTCEVKNKKITIEIKTLNSKGVDLKTKIPSLYREHELEVRNEIVAKLQRGKIEFSIFYENTASEKHTIINKEVVEQYLDQLQEIADDKKITDSSLISTVMRFPDTLKTDMPEVDKNEWVEISKAVSNTINETNNFRIQEGAVMVADLVDRIAKISSLLIEIEPFANERVLKIKERIKNNLSEVVSKDAIDNNRLEHELVFYIEKLDITEEKVRLANHCKYFKETIEKEQVAGKKLGFISQEIGREINTIGSKSNDYEMQKRVVQMKDELEKIKEQLLNVL